MICFCKVPRNCFCNTFHPYVCFYHGTSHCGVHERLPHNPSIISPRGLPGRSRPCSPHVGTFSCPQLLTFSTTHYEWSTWLSTRRVNQPTVFMPMIRPLSNSLNYKKCFLTRLPGILRCLKSSYNQHVIVTFISIPLNAGFSSWLQRHCRVYSHAHCHETWIIYILHVLSYICKVSRLYNFSFLWANFNVTEFIYIHTLIHIYEIWV